MSLVEQAIARMKSQASAAKHKRADSTKPDAPTPIVKQISESVRAGKRITFDTVAMRAGGYLPEDGQDRQFADHYRRIKRPLIEKALSGTVAVGESRVIMITSALPGDGKTFTSINLALSMALERDFSVLLVDCDVAKRHVSEILGMKEEMRAAGRAGRRNPGCRVVGGADEYEGLVRLAGRPAGRDHRGALEQQPHAADRQTPV